MSKQLFKVPIGDWSDDGHGVCDDYYIEANYSAEEMQNAYRETCRKIGLQMNHNVDYTGVEPEDKWSNWRQLLTDYEENYIEASAVKILVEHGFDFSCLDVDFDEEDNVIIQRIYFGAEDVFQLFMWFISYSMPEDFEWKEVTINAKPLIGYWGSGLNHQIGYGVFD